MKTRTEQILNRLEEVNGYPAQPSGTGWKTTCPAHDDRSPSLSIREGSRGQTQIKCFAGCSSDSVLNILKMPITDDGMGDEPSGSTGTETPSAGHRGPSSGSGDRVAQTFPTAKAAVQSLVKQLGPRTAWWQYTNVAGEPVGIVVRWDRPDGKDIRPVSRRADGWVIGAMPEPRPLLDLPNIAGADRVVVVEGEKCADVMASFGFNATTSAGGSQAADMTDWSPLAGKQIVVLPDNDSAGLKYCDSVIRKLRALHPATEVKVVDLPDLPDGGDVADFLELRRDEGRTHKDIRQELESLFAACEYEPRDSHTATSHPFPTALLPPRLRHFVETAAIGLDVPVEFLAVPMLSVLAASIGTSRTLELRPGFRVPSLLWTVIIGESGTSKSPALNSVMKPLHDRQDAAFKKLELDSAAYEQQLAHYQVELRQWQQAPAGESPVAPSMPEAERLLIGDTTVEAIVRLLKINSRGLLFANDELAFWFATFDRYRNRPGGDIGFWLTAYDAKPWTSDRKTGDSKTQHVPIASVCVTGGVQPGVLRRVLGTNERESGLASRLFFAMPQRHPRKWKADGLPEAVASEYSRIVGRLVDLPLPSAESGEGVLTLSDTAKAKWAAFYDAHGETQIQYAGDLAAAHAKLLGGAARLALVLHLARWAEGDQAAPPDTVDEESLSAGIALAKWFGHEAERVYAALGATEDKQKERELVEWVANRGGAATVRDLTHGLRRFRGRREEAQSSLDSLVKEGLGSWAPREPGVSGGRPTKVFRLNGEVSPSARQSPETKPSCDGMEASVEPEWEEV